MDTCFKVLLFISGLGLLLFISSSLAQTNPPKTTSINVSGDSDEDGYEVTVDDCDDSDPAVNPSADEICDDGADNNCDGSIDEGDCLTIDSTTDSESSVVEAEEESGDDFSGEGGCSLNQ